jgi:hypothetical protein
MMCFVVIKQMFKDVYIDFFELLANIACFVIGLMVFWSSIGFRLYEWEDWIVDE